MFPECALDERFKSHSTQFHVSILNAGAKNGRAGMTWYARISTPSPQGFLVNTRLSFVFCLRRKKNN